MPARRFTDEQEREICRRYLAGETTVQLAEALGVNSSTIGDLLKRNGVETRKRGLTDEQEQEICRRYLAGESSTQLGGDLGVSPSTIGAVVKRNGFKIRAQGEDRRLFTDEQERLICQRYLDGESCIVIGAAFGACHTTIGNILERNGVKTRSASEFDRSNRRAFTPSQDQEICRRYLAGEGTSTLGKAFGVVPGTIDHALKRNGIEKRAFIRNFTDQELQAIRQRYLAGENASQMCSDFGVSASTILLTLKRNGVKMRAKGEAQIILSASQEAEACRRYQSGESANQIAQHFGVSPSAVTGALKRNGIQTRSNIEARGGLPPAQEDEVRRRYLAGESTLQLAKAFGVSDGTVGLIIKRGGLAVRSVKESMGGLTDEQEIEVCRRYAEGETTVQLGETFDVRPATIRTILKRRGCKVRSIKEVKGGLNDAQEAEVCRRYQAGENTIQLSDSFGVAGPTICGILNRAGIERRTATSCRDSVQHVMDGTGYHAHTRECEFYLFELARYADTHCKPGIAFNSDRRVSWGNGEYGAEVLRLVFATRAEAYFLEQAVMDATQGSADCPDDLWDWAGATEVRAMPAEDMVPIVLRLADELEELGVWEFAARYVPMTAAQRAICQQRAMEPVAA